jgi:hypothetical protein
MDPPAPGSDPETRLREETDMHRSIAAAALAVLVGVAPAAYASAPNRAPVGGRIVHHPERVSFSSAGERKLAFDTSEGRFTKGVDNQGWYTLHPGFGSNRNSNYIVGSCCHGSFEYRDFFTFDLASLADRVESATLVVYDPRTKGDALETLRFSAVTTPAAQLNHNAGGDRSIFSDLGHGQLFGLFSVARGRRQVRRFQLNERAVAAINAARGEYFSVGGRLVTISAGNRGQFVFGGSDNAGVQRLIVRTSAP